MIEERVANYIRSHDLLEAEEPVLVGVSGGVDSMLLLALLEALGYSVAVAHVNYGLRGTYADRDEALVRRYCKKKDIPFHLRRVDLQQRKEEERASAQALGRRIRYTFFGDVAEREGIAQVAVGHHADDQAETLLLQLFRGTGVEGLAGMAPQRPLKVHPEITLVRPLLSLRREEIEAEARSRGIPWHVDASNRSDAYRRGALREQILPFIQEHFGEGVVENLVRTARLTRRLVEDVLAPELERRFAELRRERTEGGSLELYALRQQPPYWQGRIVLEALRRWVPGAPERERVVKEVLELTDAQVGRRVELGEGVVWRERGALFFQSKVPKGEAGAQTVEPGDTISLPIGTLDVEQVETRPEQLHDVPPTTAYFSPERLLFPLEVRPWQEGDRFQPLGMDGTKRVSDLLTDRKVPPHERHQVYVLVSDDEIVWVIGHRLGEAARLAKRQETFIRVRLTPHGT